jgi:hypothetical protein
MMDEALREQDEEPARRLRRSGPMTNQVFGKFDKGENYDPTGRWPANVIHDGSASLPGSS